MFISNTTVYNYLFTEIADPRVKNWPFMLGPWKPMGIIFIYGYLIFKYLPSHMKNRKPYDLKQIIMAYNIFQIVACIILIYGIATSGWTTHYTLGCQLADFSQNKIAVRMASFMWWNMMLKMVELVETVFFVLRKKFRQVSVLHVYHHISTFTMGWLVTKYYPGGITTFTVLINSFVHILMYTYYLFSSFGPEMQKKLEWVKPHLTVIQMMQLLIIFLHAAQIFVWPCPVNKILGYIYLPIIAMNLMLFETDLKPTCAICGGNTIIRWAWCKKFFCIKHYFEEYHYCEDHQP